MKRKRGEPSRTKIVINFIGYGMLWGTMLGVMLGAIYGAAISIPVFINTTNTLLGHIVFSLLGAIVGGIIGSVAGFTCGILMGTSMGILTRLLLNSPNSFLYRRIMNASATATTFFCAICIFSAFEPVKFDFTVSVYLVIPTIIALFASAFASNKMVDWWLEETGDKKKKCGDIAA